MGRWQPYLYNAPERNSYMDVPTTFNPKAVTEASRKPAEPRKKHDGPLVDFNKHPDSYLILPYGQTDAKPMHKSTKVAVKVARWIQLFLRICTLLGATGALLCAIFIRGTADTEGWIIRIPPGADLVICLYAIYHLIRSAKSRPPASSASYHFFALVTDAGFVPLYVFAVLMARRNADLEAGETGRWRSMFPTDEDTNKVLKTTWLTATAVAGLHIASLILDLYLVIVFRKISKMPPDMNPLEDNLTSRRKSKHKHKNSSISTITPLTTDEKRFSAQSTIAGDRNSQAAPLMHGEIPSPSKSQIAFMHTRTNSETTYSPHTPNSARQSKERFSMYSQPPSNRQSRRSLNHRDDLHRRDERDENETLAQRKSFLAEQAIKRHSRKDSYVTSSSEKTYASHAAAVQDANKENQYDASGDLSLQRSNRQYLQTDNWFVHPGQDDDDEPEAQEPQYSQPPVDRKAQMLARYYSSQPDYNAVSTHDFAGRNVSPFDGKDAYDPIPTAYDDVSDLEDDYTQQEPTTKPSPLRMNPPTPAISPQPPQPSSSSPSDEIAAPNLTLHRTQTTTSISTDATFNRSHSRSHSRSRSQSRSSTPKTRYYGDLRSATKGIREGGGANSPASASPQNGPPSRGSFRNQPNHLPSATKQYTANTPPPQKVAVTNVNNLLHNSPFTLNKKSYTSVRRTGEANYTPVKGQSPRVVSRSGVDYMNAFEFDEQDLGMPDRRRREVSGKVAEEGRGGGWGAGLVQRKVSGVA